MPCTTVVAGAAPTWIADRLRGPAHEGSVVHAGNDAVYVTSGDDVIGLVSRGAVASPCTIATRAETVADLFDDGRLPSYGDRVSIGSGAMSLGGAEVRVGRFTDLTMPRLDRAAAADLLERLAAAGGPTGSAELDPAALEELTSRPAAALPDVLGRGSGLTPFGDDVVAGLLATLLAAGDPCAGPLVAEVRRSATHRTTLLSATLLRRAAAGEVLPEFARLVAALDGPPAGLAAPLTTLLTIGHTSGRGMALGLHLALTHMTRSCS